MAQEQTTESAIDLQRIQHWYNSNCDGDWEHGYGIAIATLDNPGWSVTINLEGTDLEDAVLNKSEDMSNQEGWMQCWIENKNFYGVSDPFQLTSILSRFVELIDTTKPTDISTT